MELGYGKRKIIILIKSILLGNKRESCNDAYHLQSGILSAL